MKKYAIAIFSLVVLFSAILMPQSVNAEPDTLLPRGELVEVIESEENDESVIYSDSIASALSVTGLSNEEAIVSYFIKQLGACAQTIEIYQRGYRINLEQLRSLLYKATIDEPSLFHVDKSFSYATYSSGYVAYLIPQYKYTGSELDSARAEYDGMIEQLLSLSHTLTSDFETAVFYHEYIAAVYEYDKSYEIFDSYTMLKEKKGVCEAYTLLYSEILSRLGIEVTAAYSEKMVHIWNVVTIDGHSYHVDITHDDPLWGGYDYKGYVSHKNLLCSEEKITETDHYDWVYMSSERLTFSDRYDDMFWRELNKPVYAYSSDIYYIEPGSSMLTRYDIESGSATELFYIESRAFVHGSGSYYEGMNSGFCGYGDRLYYSEGEAYSGSVDICEYDITTGERHVLKTIKCNSGSAESVYSLYVAEDVLYYVFATSPNGIHTAEVYSLEIEKYTPEIPMDADGDGSITNADLTVLIRYLSGWRADSVTQKRADVNADGKINNRDALAIIKYITQ